MITGKKILLTGLTGQVGGAFADALAPHNELWGFARFSAPGSREKHEARGVRTVVGDLAKGDFGDLPRVFDCVIHSAANTRPGTAEVGMAQNAEGSGLLMAHCRDSGAFIHVSTCGVYTDHAEPTRKKTETDDVGGATPHAPNYGPTKTAAEGVARTLCRLFDLPTTIARINCAYGGAYDDGGLPGSLTKAILERRPFRLPRSRRIHMSPIHEDDMVGHLGPLMAAASVPAFVVNWGGYDGVPVEDMARYIGELVGLEPIFEWDDASALPNTIVDTARGESIGMTWNVRWRDGVRRMIQARHPEIGLREPGAA
jgi:nucleoside-diphosphate-sugar epimerase